MLRKFSYIIILWGMLINSNTAISDDSLSADNKALIKNYITKNIELSLVSEYLSSNMRSNKAFDYSGLQRDIDNKVPLLDSGCTFLVELQRSNFSFPDSDYTIYKYIFQGFTSCDYDTTLKGFKYNLTPTFLGSWYSGGKENTYRFGLVAWNNNEQKILFICGTLFQDNIVDYYLKDSLSSTEIHKYIQMKFYNLRPENIRIDMDDLSASFEHGYYSGILYELKFKKKKTGPSIHYDVVYEKKRLF